jgi:hypothetical protein
MDKPKRSYATIAREEIFSSDYAKPVVNDERKEGMQSTNRDSVVLDEEEYVDALEE